LVLLEAISLILMSGSMFNFFFSNNLTLNYFVPSHCWTCYFEIRFNITSHICPGFTTECIMCFLSSLFMLNVPSILYSLVWSALDLGSLQIMKVFCILVVLPPSLAQIIFSALCPQSLQIIYFLWYTRPSFRPI
jgi:hypothetical protein